MQSGMGQQPMQDPGVSQRDDGVVEPGDDHGPMPDQRQRENARPHRTGEQLMQVADSGAGHQLAVEQSLDDRRFGRAVPP